MSVAVRQTRAEGTHPEVQRAFEQLRAGYKQEPNPSLAARLDRLERLEKLVLAAKEDLVAAADQDFGGRARHESLTVEVILVVEAVRELKRNLAEWMRPQPAAPHPLYLGSSAWTEVLPKGVVAVLAPWNYPVNTALGPAASAIAAGNRVLLKPSELTPSVSAAIARGVRQHFSAEEFAVVEGGPEVAQTITRLPLDHLFFTGSTRVARLLAQAAAPNLVPLTLELGGKCPVIIHPDYPTATAAQRLATAKIFNGGQTCVAPDYVLVPAGKEELFAEAFTAAVREGWPRLPADQNYTSLVSDAAFARQQALLADATQKGARAVPTGASAEGRKLAPVLLLGVNDTMRVMQEEIFGPLLPVIGYQDLAEAEGWIEKNPHPLALYVFDQDEERARETMARIPSGGACINETMHQYVHEGIPFGGVGQSGMGSAHGRAGFTAFSHQRGVLSVSSASPAAVIFGPRAPQLLEKGAALLGSRLGAWVMDKLHSRS